MKIPLRVYADTPVFGGCFEEKFGEASTRFFEQVREGAFGLVVSDVTTRELAPAPQYVKSLLDIDLSAADIAALLERLEFTTRIAGDTVTAKTPPFRLDFVFVGGTDFHRAANFVGIGLLGKDSVIGRGGELLSGARRCVDPPGNPCRGGAAGRCRRRDHCVAAADRF